MPISGLRAPARIAAIAVVVGLVVGALTAYAQGWLSDGVGSLANSAGPWALAAFVVARRAQATWHSVLAAMATLAACELGYAIATIVRGGDNSTTTVTFWLAAAVFAGPPLGLAAAWSTRRADGHRRDAARRALGWGALAGVLIGEGLYGLARLTETTNSAYWAIELALGVGIVVVSAWLARPRRVTAALSSGAIASAAALAVFAAATAV